MTSAENEIRTYITSKQISGALFLKGNWGSGKTYLIKKIINDCKLKNDYHFVMTSFFGISTIETAENSIKHNYLFSNKILNKIEKKTNAFSDFFHEIIKKIKHGNIIDSVFSVNVYDLIDIDKNHIFDKKEIILIIDDIERAKIGTTELLGIINNYCENKGIKTIIIGNDNKFDDDVKKKFDEFKEKVVYKTIQIDNDHNEVIKNIVNNFHETKKGYVKYLLSNLNQIISVFVESETENFRLLKSCLVDYERVYCLFKKGKYNDKDINETLYSFSVYKYEIECGNFSKDEYGYIGLKNSDKYSKIKHSIILDSLIEWIATSVWDENKIKNEIEDRFANKILTADEKILKYSFWDLDSETFDIGMPILFKRGYNGQLNNNELISLLAILVALNELGVDTYNVVDFKKLRIGWDLREEKIKHGLIEETQRCRYIGNVQGLKRISNEAYDLYRTLEGFDIKRIYYDNKIKVIDAIKNSFQDVSFAVAMNPIPSFDKEIADLFIKQYIESSNGEKNDLASLVNKLDLCYEESSSNDDMCESIKNLKFVRNQLQKEEENTIGSFDRCVFSETIKVIDKKIIKLSEEIAKKK